MMLVHAGAFGLYCLSIIIYYTYSLRYFIKAAENSSQTEKAELQMFDAWIACQLMNFAAQVFFILILWKLSFKVEFVEEENSLMDATIISGNDKDFI
jgi:hypothetical protein